MTTRILAGDCLAVLPTLEANSVDAIVTDPPYELGFMGKRWDSTGVAFRHETWAAALRVAKPGAHLASRYQPCLDLNGTAPLDTPDDDARGAA